ncbi:uncharacterized protein LOC117338215 [Pecten maximus]|uniref:uncharacterized protein LOC117338215 n=1 Tax=Pecten maximus TaxID=6579 RepID=UPI001457F7D2|nr:uncharacterized protein LOC117338215 [Pecten maximus]
MMNLTNSTADSSVVTCLNNAILSDELEEVYVFILAICLIGILSCFERRKDTCRCFGGKLGCLIPVNLLDGDQDRLAYAAAFGCTTSTIITILMTEALSTQWSTLVSCK